MEVIEKLERPCTGEVLVVLTQSQQEAEDLNHNYNGTEHLLLAMLARSDGLGTRLLAVQAALPRVREAIETIIGPGTGMIMGEISQTPRLKMVIGLADAEAQRLGHQLIGTEHLWLGLIREGGGLATGILESLGVNLERLSQQVIGFLGSSGTWDVTKLRTLTEGELIIKEQLLGLSDQDIEGVQQILNEIRLARLLAHG